MATSLSKIVILADSLALPREKDWGDTAYEQTYPFLVDQALRQQRGASAPIVIERGKRSRTIQSVLLEWEEQVLYRRANFVVVHVGVVDCAPRVLKPAEQKFISRLRFQVLSDAIRAFIHRHRRSLVTWRPSQVYVAPDVFRDSVFKLQQLAAKDGVKALSFVNILMPTDSLEQRSPGFQSNVRQYNGILTDTVRDPGCQVIDINALFGPHGGTEALAVDGMHLNPTGHVLLAQELVQRITVWLSDPQRTIEGSPI